MMACEPYFPVPMISRDENVRPAITNGESLKLPTPNYQLPRLSTADEIDDLDLVALVHDDVREAVALDNRKVVLDGNTARVDLEPLEQRHNGHWLIDVVRFAVQDDFHGALVEAALQVGLF